MAVIRVVATADVAPAGDYPAVITSQEIGGPAPGKEYPYLKLGVSITEDIKGNTDLTLIVSLSPKAQWVLERTLKAAQVPYQIVNETDDNGNETQTVAFDPEHFVGKNVVCVLGHQTYKGKKQNKCEGIKLPEGYEEVEPEVVGGDESFSAMPPEEDCADNGDAIPF